MLKYAIWLLLVCTMLFENIEASPAVNSRRARSIWPFVSSEPTLESLISEHNALILKKAGLEKSLDLRSHPLWKIHKYEGIDLKPVRIETEAIKADPEIIQPSSSVAPVGQTSVDSTEAPVNSSFLNDFGGLANFLPNPKNEVEEASDLIANAIKKEEASHPGFFKKLWLKIFGGPTIKEKLEAIAEKPALGFFSTLFSSDQKPPQEETLTIYLPETQGSYAAVMVPPQQPDGPSVTQQSLLLPGQDAVSQLPQEVESSAPIHSEAFPPNHAPELTQPPAEQVPAPGNPIEAKPVAQPVAAPGNSEFSHSQAWVQSWTPQASYSANVQEPGSTAATPQVTSPAPESPETTQPQQNDEMLQRKSSEGGIETVSIDRVEGQVQEVPKQQDAAAATEDAGERGRKILLGLNLPEALLKKFQVNPKDVAAILNDKESEARASERLRALQREFEMRKDQLSYALSGVKKHETE